LAPGGSFELHFWAHSEKQRPGVIERALMTLGITDPTKMLIKSEGPVALAHGTVCSIRLFVEDLQIEKNEKALMWTGEVGCASFVLSVAKGMPAGNRKGFASIRVNSVEIARMDFVLAVSKKTSRNRPIRSRLKKYKNAFASYASEDRDAVIARIQGMQKMAPNLNVFLDAASLRSGQLWETEILTHIRKADIFYLFWCRHAKASEWVAKEWRCAYEHLGLDLIDPIPLESPEDAPPPAELSMKHFNHPWLHLMKTESHHALPLAKGGNA
jgi:hypothetical protein